MKSRFKILALFIFLLMLGSWYFTSENSVKPKTYPNIQFQTKEERDILHKNRNAVVSNSWDMSSVYVTQELGINKPKLVTKHSANKLERTNSSYITVMSDKKSQKNRNMTISIGNNVKYGRSSFPVRNGNIAYNTNPIINNKLIVGNNRGFADLITSDVILTGQRFGASAPCLPGHTHELGPDGRCIHCGATLSAAGDGTGEVEWVPIPAPVYPFILLSLLYISILLIKRKI